MQPPKNEREASFYAEESEQLAVFQAAGLGLWRCDGTSLNMLRDGNFNRMLGLDRSASAEPLRDHFQHVFVEDRTAVESALVRALQERGGLDITYRLVRADGTTCWVKDRAGSIKGAKETWHLSGVVQEMTQQNGVEHGVSTLNWNLEKRLLRRTAELEESNRNLEAFAYSVSHDLRAPLRIISGYSEILLEDRGQALPEDHKLCLTRIVDGAQKMNLLIDELLKFSRLGRQPLRWQRVNLDQVIDLILSELAPQIKERAIEWRRAPLPALECDAGLIQQVFSILISNAVKFTRGRNPATIEIGSTNTEEGSVIFCKDSGAGFDMNAATRLFGVFQRFHTAQEFEGSGMGLASAARIIQRHGGRIWAESKPDQGAAFYFSIPPNLETLDP